MKNCLFIQKVYFSNDGSNPIIKGRPFIFHYTDLEKLCLQGDMNEIICGLPKNGDKTCTLKKGYHARLLVRVL